MAKLHFLTTDLPFTTEECADYAKQFEAALAANGRPNDKVIVTALLTWLGSVDIEEQANGAQ